MMEQVSQRITGSNFFEPDIHMCFFLGHTSWPQSINKDSISIFCIIYFVNTFRLHHNDFLCKVASILSRMTLSVSLVFGGVPPPYALRELKTNSTCLLFTSLYA